MNPNQHTKNWWLARRGHITGSRMRRVVRGTWRGWTTLMNELQAELESDDPPPDQWNGGPAPAAIRWGHQWETPAIDNFTLDYGMEAARPPFIASKKLPYIGASSDFLVLDGFDFVANGEVKCPFSIDRHSIVLMSGKVPDEHLPQIDCQMFTHDLEVTYFVSFNPDMPDPQSRLAVVEVPWDRDREDYMLERCAKFYEIFQRGERPGPNNTARSINFPTFNI